MKQQVFVEILKPDKNGITILEKFDPEKGSSLDSFLWIHARNRLHNFKRDNFARPDLPCDACPLKAYVNKKCTKFKNTMDCEYYFKWYNRNEVKKSLASNQGASDPKNKGVWGVENAHYETDIDSDIFQKEIFKLVDKKIPVTLREDWIRFINKLKITKQKREQILSIVFEILKENGIEPETW